MQALERLQMIMYNFITSSSSLVEQKCFQHESDVEGCENAGGWNSLNMASAIGNTQSVISHRLDTFPRDRIHEGKAFG